MGGACQGASDCYELNDQTNDKNTFVDSNGTQIPVKGGYGNAADHYARQVRVVIKAQAAARGFLARRKSKRPVSSRSASKRRYFQDTDYWETLSSKKISMTNLLSKNPKLEVRKYTYKTSGAVYDGQWLAGFRHGSGTIKFNDGAEYAGEWYLGKCNGHGTFQHTSGERYEGSWLNDKAHGQGTFKHKNGAVYAGGWYRDLQQGRGQETWPDSSKFEGEYVSGKKNGYGVHSWADGSIYKGGWSSNQISGFGHYKWGDGKAFVGKWGANVMSGYGVYTWPDGREYSGFFKEDSKHGYGVYKYKDNSKYAGCWFKGKQHGFGIYTTADTKKKYGVWSEGKKAKTLKKDDIQALISGETDGRSLLGETVENWKEIQTFTVNFFYPQGQFEEGQIAHEKALKQHKKLTKE